MNIIQQQKLLEALTDQEIQGANAPEYLKQVEVKRRVEMRNAYQAQQQQADDNKTVAEKNMEELMMGGIPSADPMMGQGGDPSMQAGIAGGMEGPQGPQGPPMMYGGGMLGFDGGGPVSHRHPHDPRSTSEYVAAPNLEVIQKERAAIDESVGGRDAEYEAAFQEWNQNQRSQGNFTATRKDFERSFEGRQIAGKPGRASEFIQPSAVPHLAGAEQDVYDKEVESLLDSARSDAEYEHFREQLATPVSRFAGLGSRSRRPDEVTKLREEDVTGIFREQLESEEGLSGKDTTEGDEEDELLKQVAGLISDRTMAGAGGAGSPSSFHDELRDIYGAQLKREIDPELRAESRGLQTDATNAALARARGIKSLSDARIEEQTQLLAEELGMSKDRVNELRNEMETPESLEKRRRASLFSALGATIAGDPRGLAAGLERTTDKLISLDDKIGLETKAQRDAIRAEKEKGFGVKKAGKSAIYGETRSGEKELGTALSSFDDANVAMQKAIESQDVDAYSRNSDRMTNLLLEQARAASAALDAENQQSAMLAKIQQEGKNYWVNPVNWPHIDNLIMHTRAQADRFKDTDPKKMAQMHAAADNFEAMKTQHATASGTGVVTDKVTKSGPQIFVPGATSP